MSDLNDFLRAAREESEEQRFERDYEAGLVPVEKLIGRVRLVGDRGGGGLAVPYQLSDQDFQAYYSNRSFDFDSKPELPPPLA